MLKLEKCCCIIIGLSMLKLIAFYYCCYELLLGVQNTQSLLRRWTVLLENQGVECDIAKQSVCFFDDKKSRNFKIREMDACRTGMT